MNLHGRADPARGISSGLAEFKAGLRLRYELRRECAPYLGVVWMRRGGAPGDIFTTAADGPTGLSLAVGGSGCKERARD